MKKILICLLVLFLVGCAPISEFKGLEEIKSVEPTEDIEEQIDEGIKFAKEIIAEEYKLLPGESLIVGDKRLELLDITSDYEVIINIDGKEYVIYETNKKEIVNNLEILLTRIKFDPTGKDTYVILKAKEYELGTNEYIMYINDKIIVQGHTIILLDVDTDKLQSINLRVGNIDKRINKGKTEIINNLKITNLETNPRAITAEKYAIIKVLPLL